MPRTMPRTTKVDNFGLIDEFGLLDFREPGDIYVFHALKREKDMKEAGTIHKGDAGGDAHRLVRTWYVDSMEYYERNVEFMKKLCDDNDARLYMIPQVRNRLVCRRLLLHKIVDLLDDPNVRDDNIVRSSICGCHQSRNKLWVLDVDFDDKHVISNPGKLPVTKDSKAGLAIIDAVSAAVEKAQRQSRGEGCVNHVYPTRNGFGIVMTPCEKLLLLGHVWNHDDGCGELDPNDDGPDQESILVYDDASHVIGELTYQILDEDIKTKGGMMLVYCNF